MRCCGLEAIVPRARRLFLIGLLRVAFVGLVPADDASGNGAHLSMPRHVARHTSDDSALDTSLCLHGCGS